MKYPEDLLLDETHCVTGLLDSLKFSPQQAERTQRLAEQFIAAMRKKVEKNSAVEALMAHYDLSTPEGVMLMNIAEALLRIPDTETQKLLIRDKLSQANWKTHLGKSPSTFVNLVTYGLSLGSRWSRQGYGEPAIRKAVRHAVKIIGNQFVIGRHIDSALRASRRLVKKGYVYSYDMLGEVARTQADADRYFQAYRQAIIELADNPNRPAISIKLSALYPRYSFSHEALAKSVLIEKLHQLADQARQANLGLTIDAEETERLNLSLEIFSAVFTHPDFKDWDGLSMAVQAYQKCALEVIDTFIELARQYRKRIGVRLVKGAYWDSEIKFAQIGGFKNYPVFTRKITTDLNYLACAQKMLAAQDAVYPQFATHNAYSAAAILTMMEDFQNYDFEFQSLQGMGRALHDQLLARGIKCRIYAPVGHHEDLLPYLVRRLLENGANSSFLNQLSNSKIPLEKLIINPIERIKSLDQIPNPKIPLPKDLFGGERRNSSGIALYNPLEFQQLQKELQPFLKKLWQATPLLKPINHSRATLVLNPADQRQIVGHVNSADKNDVEEALQIATRVFPSWNRRSVGERADILLRAAELFEQHRAELICLAAREAGKTLTAGIAEVREAIDFCRYYSQTAIKTLGAQSLSGAIGETNTLHLSGRGALLCISPWNFPIAIFTGQITAALITGNSVIAKPAEQTPLTADLIVRLLHQAGVPEEVVQLLPGSGETVGAALIADPRIQGVLFTGSTDTAKVISQALAERPGPMVPFIAETGGINVMIADSSALPEQLVNDVIISAFDSAGQRCSALRVLFVQKEIADKVLTMLQGAMAELCVGDPLDLQTDVGPVIDAAAQKMLNAHREIMDQHAKLIYQAPLSASLEAGIYVAPQAYELADLSLLGKEVFGPILHVIRYSREQLPAVVRSINDLGYGLTFGIQSRIDSTIQFLQNAVQAGNIYVNRNMIGAVVGVQPFGGHRLSGTGPKGGGPHYLIRLCQEYVLTTNTTATGGNPELMSLADD